VHEAYCPQSCLGGGSGTSLAQHLLDHAQKDLQHGGDGTRIVPKEIAQPLRKRQHPLAHRQPREDVIDQVRRRLHHAPGIARRT
jgi:hypothetical protein